MSNKTPTSFRIPPDLLKKIKDRADHENRSVTSMILHALITFFTPKEKKK